MSIEPDVQTPLYTSNSRPVPEVSGQMSAPEGPQQDQQLPRGMFQALYKTWDVDTSDVIDRIKMALNPFSSVPFLTNGMATQGEPSQPGTIANGKQPDMWGPVWIYFTLVFAVFFSSTMAGLFNSIGGEYDVGMLTGNAFTLFAFTFVVPVIAWFSIQYLDLVPTLTLMQTVCLYGYSCIVWVPAVIIAGSPLGADAIVGSLAAILVRALLVSIAFLISAKFIYTNLYKVMSAQESNNVSIDTKRGIVLVAGLVLHAALGFTVYFLIYRASKNLKDIANPIPDLSESGVTAA